MNLLRNLRLGRRMAVGFGSLLTLLVIVTAIAISNFRSTSAVLDQLLGSDLVKSQAVAQLETATRANATRTMELLLTDDAARQALLRDRIATNRKLAGEAIATLERLVALPEAKARLAEVLTLRGRYIAAFQRVDSDLAKGLRDEARERAQGEVVPLLEQLIAAVKSLDQLMAQLSQASATEVRASVDSAVYWLAGIGAAALVLGVVMAGVLARSVTGPVAQAVAVARQVAGGNLAVAIRAESHDEIGDLLRALSEMNTRLAGVVGSVRANAESVATASAQIAQGNQDLSQRTEEQASALQQTAASMEQLGATVRHNADSATQANQLARGATDIASRGGDAMERVVRTMAGIHDSSRRIADIIGTIDGIAFQTNILALNAAVEAARAGEQGRGFAVVAGEVRSLAQRAADAAREIKSLITASVEQVEQGSTLVQEAGGTMHEVVGAIQRVSDIVGEISHASVEQSNGVSQIGQAVTQMDQVTQQNAALVEESAAAADSLRVQADQMVSAVAVFRLAGDAAAA